MSAEVISMEEFNNSKVEKMGPYEDEQFTKDFEWAMEQSHNAVHLAGNTIRVLLLIHHLVEDTLLHCEGLPKEVMADIKESFKTYVDSGIESFEAPCSECGE
jgi:hypothetical protein